MSFFIGLAFGFIFMLNGFTLIDTLVLIAYMLLVLLLGIYFSKQKIKTKEFFKGDGSIPWFVTSVSLFATILSPLSFLSLVGNSYNGSWLLWFAQLGTLIAVPLTIIFFLPLYARLGIDTAYHYLEIRFKSSLLRVLGALMFIFFQFGRMAIVMYLPCLSLANLTQVDVNILIVAMGSLAIIYAYKGGLKAVLWTDFLQGLILLSALVIALSYLIFKLNNGFSDISHALIYENRFLLPEEKIIDFNNLLQGSIIVTLIGGAINTFCTYISSQDVVQRFTTTTKVKQLNKIAITNGLLTIACISLLYLIGSALYIYYAQNEDKITPLFRDSQDQVFAYFIAYELPIGITGIILSALFAAAQSTISTGINAIASSWVMDIQMKITPHMDYKEQTKIARYISCIVGVLAIVLAIYLAHSDVSSAYVLFKSFLGQTLGALGGVFILGALTKNTSALGAILGFISATLSVALIQYYLPNVSFWLFSLIAIFITLGVGIITSRCQKIWQNSKKIWG